MEIKTEQDIIEFCKKAYRPLNIMVFSEHNRDEEALWDRKNIEMIERGKIAEGSHLQQGIVHIGFSDEFRCCLIQETPFIYPSSKILAENPELTGPMTGNLSNCYDPAKNLFLFHMRGTKANISSPFGFQAAAAGMGVYGQNPGVTAALELCQEAGLEKFRQLFNGKAVDVLPFMKGGKLPQLLFSFGFSDDLSGFPVCRSLDDIAEFETNIKESLKKKTLEQKEGYHFTIPYRSVEEVAGRLNDSKRFFGPIYESTINFIRALKDSGQLE